MDLEDREYFCELFMVAKRDEEAVDMIKSIFRDDPILTKERRVLFHSCYKQLIDSFRSSIQILSQCLEVQLNLGMIELVKVIQSKKEKLTNQLLPICNECIGIIDNILLPNVDCPHDYVFLKKFVGDLYRYIAEYSDEVDCYTATIKASSAYEEALQSAEDNLTSTDPVKLSAVLNAAVFQVENQNNYELGIELLDHAVKSCNESFQDLSIESQEETTRILQYMRSNLFSWMHTDRDNE